MSLAVHSGLNECLSARRGGVGTIKKVSERDVSQGNESKGSAAGTYDWGGYNRCQEEESIWSQTWG